MEGRKEATNEILAEMRECEGWEAYYDGGKYHDSYYESVVSVWSLHDYAERLDAAIGRELGDVAKMREAIKEAIPLIQKHGYDFDPESEVGEQFRKAISILESAISTGKHITRVT